jgi:hypothetical protein
MPACQRLLLGHIAASLVLPQFRRARSPSPQPILYPRPEIALTVLTQTESCFAKTTVFAGAVDATFLNRAEPPGGNAEAAGPYRAFMILEERTYNQPGKFRVLG